MITDIFAPRELIDATRTTPQIEMEWVVDGLIPTDERSGGATVGVSDT